jgi:hypothetical protein
MSSDAFTPPIQPLARRDGGRRELQVTLGVLSVIPFLSGLAGMLVGPKALPGATGPLDPTADSEYRFVSAFWFFTAPVIWSAIPHIEQRTSLVRRLTAVVFAGGLAVRMQFSSRRSCWNWSAFRRRWPGNLKSRARQAIHCTEPAPTGNVLVGQHI